MTKHERLHEKIDEFVSHQSGAFCLDDIANDPGIIKVTGKNGVSREEILYILVNGCQVFSPDSRTFIPRRLYFKDARFLISPTDEEISNGILVPGHRFLPFCDPLCYPWECSLFRADRDQDGKVPQKVIIMELNALQIFFTLIGVEHMGELLCEDQPSNFKALDNAEMSGQSRFQITVFDLHDLYREWGFKRGDAILCETHDWTEGIYTIGYLSAEKRRSLMASSAKWVSALETGFHKAFVTRGFGEETDEQIAYAYYYAGSAVLKTPPIHLGGFIELTNKVHILSVGFDTRLWYEKDLKFSHYLKKINSEQPSVAPGSLEALLNELKAPCSGVEIEAFMRDELFRRKGIIAPNEFDDYSKAIMLRIFGDRAKQFTEKQWDAIAKLFRKLWTKISKSYNYFQDQIGGKVRNGLLVMLDDYFRWMEGFSHRFPISDDSPAQHIAGLGQYMADFVSYFELLNNIGPDDEQDVKELYDILPRINETIEMMEQATEEQFNAETPQFPEHPQLHLVQPDDDKPKHIFVFRITIKDTKPLVWRTVQVPGCFTLGELHYVIQDIMDWTDTHSHYFEINKGLYGSDLYNEFAVVGMKVEDEHAHTLDSLDLTDKQRFTYLYDFSDQWVHQILVSKIMPSSNFSKTDWRYPVCLSGKRACPPEGCGGLPGYERLVEAFNEPDTKESRELLAYYPNFNPELFKVDVINEILCSDVDGDE